MAFKPNYRQQRSDRNRAKEQKKQEKLQKREEDAARRKAARDDTGDMPTDEAPSADGTPSDTAPETPDGPQENPH
jgi:hypothetical protein